MFPATPWSLGGNDINIVPDMKRYGGVLPCRIHVKILSHVAGETNLGRYFSEMRWSWNNFGEHNGDDIVSIECFVAFVEGYRSSDQDVINTQLQSTNKSQVIHGNITHLFGGPEHHFAHLAVSLKK